MQFWKMNGAGNDFIILNNLQEGLSADCFPALARRLCERRLSIGAAVSYTHLTLPTIA